MNVAGKSLGDLGNLERENESLWRQLQASREKVRVLNDDLLRARARLTHQSLMGAEDYTLSSVLNHFIDECIMYCRTASKAGDVEPPISHFADMLEVVWKLHEKGVDANLEPL